MLYVVNISHYNPGYSYSETFDTGTTETTFVAEEWFKEYDGVIDLEENEWIEIKVLLYKDGDDPMFASPIAESTYVVENEW